MEEPVGPNLERDLKCTITIVFWYNVHTEPIRLQQMAPQFPLFQLSRLGTLVADLGLTESSYLDTYNHSLGRWEQHTISTIRVVETNQRLLYRIRRSLLNGLREDECPTLDEELSMQPPPSSASKKRSAPGSEETLGSSGSKAIPTTPSLPATEPPHNASSSSGTSTKPVEITPPASPAPVLSLYPKSPETYSTYQTQGGFYTAPAAPELVILPMYLINPTTDPSPIPYHPHPPLKRWPNDYTVAQLSQGFSYLEALCSHSQVMVITSEGQKVSVTTPTMSQKAGFERVFGSRYVKSTVCRHRGVWRKAPPELREEFESYEDEDRGIWGEFVRRVEGKPPGKSTLANQRRNHSPSPQSSHSSSQASTHPHEGQMLGMSTAASGHDNLIFQRPFPLQIHPTGTAPPGRESRRDTGKDTANKTSDSDNPPHSSGGSAASISVYDPSMVRNHGM